MIVMGFDSTWVGLWNASLCQHSPCSSMENRHCLSPPCRVSDKMTLFFLSYFYFVLRVFQLFFIWHLRKVKFWVVVLLDLVLLSLISCLLKGSIEKVWNLKQILGCYEWASCQCVNFLKSSILFFPNVG